MNIVNIVKLNYTVVCFEINFELGLTFIFLVFMLILGLIFSIFVTCFCHLIFFLLHKFTLYFTILDLVLIYFQLMFLLTQFIIL